VQGPLTEAAPLAQRPPNIIVIMADDLGINDVSTHGGGHTSEGVPTPNIDSIARDGVRFDQGYAGSAVCTVSRAALMTGRYPWRFGVEFTPTPGAMARVAGELYSDPKRVHPVMIDKVAAKDAKDFNDLGMPDTEITMAEALKAKGYHTMHVGKWHLGSTPEMRPNNQGFDETVFMESGLYLPQKDPRVVNSKQDFDPIDKFLWPNMRFGVSYNNGKWFEPNKYLTDYFTDEAVTAIRRNKNQPFFLPGGARIHAHVCQMNNVAEKQKRKMRAPLKPNIPCSPMADLSVDGHWTLLNHLCARKEGVRFVW
jgi:uncharacterized sulfatase